jgi:hypothetical protein
VTDWTFLAPQPSAELAAATSTPRFSVVIAAYNVAPYIGAAVESALGQSEPPLEVIVCDDGSTDGLDRALEPYLSRVVLVRQPNQGEAAAKNAAIRAASGDFVSILDGDDVYASRRLEALGALARHRPDLDILSTDADIVEDGMAGAPSKLVGRYHQLGKPFEVDDQRTVILDHNFILCPAVRRSAILAIGGFDEDIRYATDWDCWLRMIHAGVLAGYVDAPLVTYRRRPGQLTADEMRIRAGEVALLQKKQGMKGLRDHEREALSQSLSVARLLRARAALLANHPSARRAALAVARDRRRGKRVRALSLLAVPAPGAVRWLESRRHSGLTRD